MPVTAHPLSAEQLMAYLDGELPAREAGSAAAHLQHCRECQAVAADFQSVSRHLSAWQAEVPTPTPFSAPILKQMEAPSRTGWLMQHRWALGLVAIPILLLVIPLFFSQHSPAPRLEQFAKLQNLQDAPNQSFALQEPAARSAAPAPAQPAADTSSPLIIRTAQLRLTANDFAHIRESISRILNSRAGYIAQLEINTRTGETRFLSATLRIPATQLEETLADLKHLGRVDSESLRGEEVTQRAIDVQARLSNLRVTETRLTDILRQRTGKLSDVLAVEEQIDSVRGQIETTEAEQKSLTNQIAFASVQLTVNEEYKKSLTLNNTSLLTRLRNAAVEGFQTLANVVIGVVLFLLSTGPVLLVFGGLLFFPARALWKRRQGSATEPSSLPPANP